MNQAKFKLVITIVFGLLLAVEILLFFVYAQGIVLKMLILAAAGLAYLLMFFGRYTLIAFFGLFLSNFAVLNVFGFLFQVKGSQIFELLILLFGGLLWLIPLGWGEWSRWRAIIVVVTLLSIGESEWVLASWNVDPLIKALILILPVGLVKILGYEFRAPILNFRRIVLAIGVFAGLLGLSLWQVSRPGFY